MLLALEDVYGVGAELEPAFGEDDVDTLSVVDPEAVYVDHDSPDFSWNLSQSESFTRCSSPELVQPIRPWHSSRRARTAYLVAVI